MTPLSTVPKTKQEKRTAFVVLFSAATMIFEIVFGIVSNSMALLADGIHMGAHVLAIGLTWASYVYLRYLQAKEDESVDKNRLLTLASFISSIFLFVFAAVILVEGFKRLFMPTGPISCTEAMIVAVIGLFVNLISALVLHSKKEDEDYNVRSAFLHVLADVLTSVGAILGIGVAMLWNINWVDTVIAIACSLVIFRWAIKLIYDTAKLLIIKPL